MPGKEKWLVFYTKARAEKKVDELLKRDGFESFLPTQIILKQWSDRKKKVEVPLFNSYLFVRTDESLIPKVLQTPGIAWNIRHNGKPAVVRDEEIQLIKRFIETGLFVDTDHKVDIEKGDKVEVMEGPLRGSIGYVSGDYNEELFTMIVDTIDQSLTVRIDGKILKKLEN